MCKNRDKDWALILILVEIIIEYWRRAFKWVIWNVRLVKSRWSIIRLIQLPLLVWYSQFLQFWCDYSSSVIKSALLWFLIIHRPTMLFSITSWLVSFDRGWEKRITWPKQYFDKLENEKINKFEQKEVGLANISWKETENYSSLYSGGKKTLYRTDILMSTVTDMVHLLTEMNTHGNNRLIRLDKSRRVKNDISRFRMIIMKWNAKVSIYHQMKPPL